MKAKINNIMSTELFLPIVSLILVLIINIIKTPNFLILQYKTEFFTDI